jgi:hypothetical protein
MPEVLGGPDGATRAPDYTDGAANDQGAPHPLLECKWLSQDRRCQDRDHQRRDTGKSAPHTEMGVFGRSEPPSDNFGDPEIRLRL